MSTYDRRQMTFRSVKLNEAGLFERFRALDLKIGEWFHFQK